MPKVSYSCCTTFSLPACTYGLMRSSLPSDDIGREDSNMVYRWFSTICWHYTKWKTMILHPFLEHSWRAMVKGNPSKVSTTLESVPGCLFYLEGEKAICEITHQFMSCDQSLADGEGLRRNMTGKLVTRKFGGKVCDKPLWMGKNIKIFASYWMPKGWPWKRKIFIIRWIEWPILWIPLSLFPQPSLSSPNGFIYKVAKVTRTEVIYGLSNMDLHSSKPTWLWPLCQQQRPTLSAPCGTIYSEWSASYLVTGYYTGLLPLWKRQCFVLIGTYILDTDLPSLHSMFLSKLPTMDTIIVFHTALLLIKKLISQQTKYSNRLVLMEFAGLNHIPHHSNVASLIKWNGLLKTQLPCQLGGNTLQG